MGLSVPGSKHLGGGARGATKYGRKFVSRLPRTLLTLGELNDHVRGASLHILRIAFAINIPWCSPVGLVLEQGFGSWRSYVTAFGREWAVHRERDTTQSVCAASGALSRLRNFTALDACVRTAGSLKV